MKWRSSAFRDDTVLLTWWDLLLLALGRSVRDGACVVSRQSVKP